MGTKLVISEYITPSLIWLERIVRLAVTALSAAVVVMFWIQMNSLLERKQEYVTLEAKYATYESFLEQGHICLEEGAVAESEQWYRKAMELVPELEESYLGLADVFIQVREYQEALHVLELYQGEESDEVSAVTEQLQALMESLGKSVLH